MAVFVVPVLRLPGQTQPHHDDQGGEDIGGGVYGIRHHGRRAAQNTRRQLAQREQQIDDDALTGDLDRLSKAALIRFDLFHGTTSPNR